MTSAQRRYAMMAHSRAHAAYGRIWMQTFQSSSSSAAAISLLDALRLPETGLSDRVVTSRS